MNAASILSRISFAVRREWKQVRCRFLTHDAEGPLCVDYEHSPGVWRPFYQCRNCGKILRWKEGGGWLAERY